MRPQDRNDLIVAAEHALIAEAIAVIAGFLGFVIFINGYAIFAQIGAWQ